jgi:hypothetical protein
MIEAEFPGLEVHLCFRKESMYLVEDEPRIVSPDNYKKTKRDFGYVRELACNSHDHPVEQLMIESKIPYKPVPTKPGGKGDITLSLEGSFPTMPLNAEQASCLEEMAKQGNDTDWVLGVESEKMMIAAWKGARVSLVPMGIGTNLVKKLFPQTEILDEVAYISLKTQDRNSK